MNVFLLGQSHSHFNQYLIRLQSLNYNLVVALRLSTDPTGKCFEQMYVNLLMLLMVSWLAQRYTHLLAISRRLLGFGKGMKVTPAFGLLESDLQVP